MAGENEATAEYASGVDIDQARGMWSSFVRLVKWAIGLSVVALLLMAAFLVWT